MKFRLQRHGWVLLCLLAVLAFQALPARGLSAQPPAGPGDDPNPQQPAAEPAYRVYIPLTVQPPLPRTVNTFGLETWSYHPSTTGTKLVDEANFYWIRRNGLLWSDVEPTLGARNWTASSVASLEKEMLNAASSGKQIILIVRSTPAWAQKFSGSSCGPIKEENIDEFASFMADVVKRYSVAPYSVKYFEIWNEQDAPFSGGTGTWGCWGDQADPYYGGGYYARVLKQAYPQMKAANPEIQVLIGGLLLDCDPENPPSGKDCTMSKYLEGILLEGGGPYFDIVSFHSYDWYCYYGMYMNSNWGSNWNTTGPAFIAKARFLRRVLARYQVSGKRLFLTEVALECNTSRDDCGTVAHQLTKAYYLSQAYAAAIVEGLDATIWYHQYNIWEDTGLMDVDDDPVYDAYYAAKFASHEMGVTTGGSDKSQGSLFIYELNTAKGRLWLVWSKDAAAHDLSLSSLPVAAYNAFGSPLSVSKTMNIGVSPVYLEWGAP